MNDFLHEFGVERVELLVGHVDGEFGGGVDLLAEGLERANLGEAMDFFRVVYRGRGVSRVEEDLSEPLMGNPMALVVLDDVAMEEGDVVGLELLLAAEDA